MHRCRQIAPDHIRILRQALGVDCCPTPCANYYVAGAEEFDLLEEMIRMGLMKYTRSVLDCRCYAVTDRGARVVGLEVPTREQVRSWPDGRQGGEGLE
jgi:hypothetical protein